MNELKNVEDLIAKLDAVADDLEHHPAHKVESQVVRTAVMFIEQMTTDAWHDALREKPTRGGTYLCVVIYPDNRGGFVEAQRVLRFDRENDWSCQEMIVTHWREKPAFPAGGVLSRG